MEKESEVFLGHTVKNANLIP